MVDISQSGFMATQPKPAVAGPQAKRKVVQGPDGTPHVVYVDLNTGQELQNLAGYNIVESSNYMDLDSLGLSPTGGTEEPKKTVAQETIQNVNPIGTRGEKSDTNRPAASRSPSNNFGYINQPGFMGPASMLPGLPGMGVKAAKAAIGMNNNAAINSARGMMGLPDQSFGDDIKGAVKDRKGHVADVNINNNMYSVGLEALDPRGMTTMTPDEAAKRAQANKVKIELADEDMIAQKEREFDEEFGMNKGILGGFVSKASSFIDSIFGTEDKETKAIREQNSGSRFSPSESGFADMIGSGSGVGKAATSTKTSPVSGAARSTAGKTGRSDPSGGGSLGNRASSGPTGGRMAGPI